MLAAREYLASLPGVDTAKIAVAGSGQGGMLALYSAAIEPRFAAASIGSYFNERSHSQTNRKIELYGTFCDTAMPAWPR